MDILVNQCLAKNNISLRLNPEPTWDQVVDILKTSNLTLLTTQQVQGLKNNEPTHLVYLITLLVDKSYVGNVQTLNAQTEEEEDLHVEIAQKLNN